MGDALPSLSPPLPKSPAAGPHISIGRLPVTNPQLFGREKELAWLDACWRDEVRVASIVAWGGVGKSALVNAWLRQMDARGWEGAERVFGWSFYSQGTDRMASSDEFFAVALREFGDEATGPLSQWDKGERLAKLVKKERAILVLDGLEPLQWGPGEMVGRLKDQALEALLKELGAQNRGLCVVTSRVHVADLEALDGDKVEEHGLDHLDADAGAELLEARGVKGLPEELKAASVEYEGHSLSLTLLGAYLRKACKGDVRARDTIPAVSGKPAERMMARYEAWFRDKPELAILRLLGFFERPAPQDEIAALLAQPAIAGLTEGLDGLGKARWNEAVETLCEVGLLARSEGEDERLDAHPLVREHFGAQLEKAQPEAWKEGHRRLYEHLEGKAKEYPDTVEEMAPLYAAVVHGCMAGKSQEALDDVYFQRIQRAGEHYSWYKLGAYGNEVAMFSVFFDPPWENLAAGLSKLDQAWLLNETGNVLRAVGRQAEAMDLMFETVARYVAEEEWHSAAIAKSSLADLFQTRGELHRAEAAGLESVALADRGADALVRMATRTTLAATLHALGRWDAAAALFEEAERMQIRDEPAYPLLYSLRGFRYCDILLDQGRAADVLARAAHTLQWGKKHLFILDAALDHLSLGRVHLLADQRALSLPVESPALSQARTHLQQALDGLRRASMQEFLPLGLLARAAYFIHTRAFDDARRDLTDALALSTRCGFRLHECDAHLGFARLALAEGDRPAAAHHHEAARRLVEATSYHRRDSDLADLAAHLAA